MSIYTNLEAVYLLDEGSGSSAGDSTSHARTGTLHGSPAWTSGGLVFDRASSQYVDISGWAGIGGTGAKSVACRFQTTDASNTIRLWGWGNTSSSGSSIALSIEAGTIYVRCNSCNGSFGTGVTDGSAHRLLVIVPASATMADVQVWVDGTQRTGTFANGTTALNTDAAAGTVMLGKYWLGSNDYFNGTIYETYFWSQALDSDARTLLFAGDYPWVAITPTDLTASRIYQRGFGTTAKTITFAGSYLTPTDPATIEVKIVRAGTSTLVQDWTALSSATIGSGSYSGSLSVPSQDYLYNYLARAKDGGGTVLVTSTQTSNAWGVGVLIGCTGQSNMSKMFNVSSAPPTPHANTRMYYGSWMTASGNGAIRLANELHTLLGCPIGLLPYAVDDTGLVYDTGAGVWQAGSSPYINFLAAIAAVGGDLEAVLQHQGEADMKGLTSKSAYKAQLATEYAGFCGAVTRGSNLLFGIAVTGTFSHASATDASAQAIREAQVEYGTETGGNVFLAGSSLDMVRSDQAHWTAPYYERMACRYAQSLACKKGLVSYDGIGPSVASAILVGNVIIINLSLHNHASLTELDGTTDGGSLSGWEASIDDFANPLTISSTAFVDNEIRLTLPALPASLPKLRYLYGKTPTITNTVHGNRLPANDTVGPSVMPLSALQVGRVGTGYADSVDGLLSPAPGGSYLDVFSSFSLAADTSVYNANLWGGLGSLLDFTGIGHRSYPATTYYSKYVAITKRHLLTTQHTILDMQDNDQVTFHASDGTRVTRTVTTRLAWLGSADANYAFFLNYLDSDLPGTISTYPLMTDMATDLVGLPVIRLDQEHHAHIADVATDSKSYDTALGFAAPANATRQIYYEDWITGDSGSPAFLLVGLQLIYLLSAVFGGGAGAGPNCGKSIGQILAGVSYLNSIGGTSYLPTLYGVENTACRRATTRRFA